MHLLIKIKIAQYTIWNHKQSRELFSTIVNTRLIRAYRPIKCDTVSSHGTYRLQYDVIYTYMYSTTVFRIR